MGKAEATHLTVLSWPSLPESSAYRIAGRIAAEARREQAGRRIPHRALAGETPERVREFYDLVSAGRPTNGYDATERQRLVEIAEGLTPRIVLAAPEEAPAPPRAPRPAPAPSAPLTDAAFPAEWGPTETLEAAVAELERMTGATVAKAKEAAPGWTREGRTEAAGGPRSAKGPAQATVVAVTRASPTLRAPPPPVRARGFVLPFPRRLLERNAVPLVAMGAVVGVFSLAVQPFADALAMLAVGIACAAAGVAGLARQLLGRRA